MKKKGIVFDISHYMTEDGPGIRTNVFLKGCPLKCRWCSNIYGINPKIQLAFRADRCTGCGECLRVCRYGAVYQDEERKCCLTDFQKCVGCMKCVKVCPAGARIQVGREYSSEEIIKEVEKDKSFYRRSQGGITLSGGEILMQPEFALEILVGCKDRFLNTAIETSACGRWEDLKKLILNSDTVFIDCKCMDSHRHKELTGVDNVRILENIRKAADLCAGEKIHMVIRLPLIPSLNDTSENLSETARFVRALSGKPLLNVLPYHNYGESKYDTVGENYTLSNLKIPSGEYLKKIDGLFREAGVNCSIGGYNIDYDS